MQKPDSLILDMDGTLWDNVDTYVLTWNAALKEIGSSVRVARESFMGMMGKEAQKIVELLVPNISEQDQNLFFEEVLIQYKKLQPAMQPYIYPGVLNGLKRLHTKYKLFLLSNCEEGGLVTLMNHTKTSHLFLDYMEHGQNNMPKNHNIKLLKERHNLESPIYVGDTEGDSHESSLAGVPFVFMTYGFGTTENYHLKFDTFGELTNYYMNL